MTTEFHHATQEDFPWGLRCPHCHGDLMDQTYAVLERPEFDEIVCVVCAMEPCS